MPARAVRSLRLLPPCAAARRRSTTPCGPQRTPAKDRLPSPRNGHRRGRDAERDIAISHAKVAPERNFFVGRRARTAGNDDATAAPGVRENVTVIANANVTHIATGRARRNVDHDGILHGDCSPHSSSTPISLLRRPLRSTGPSCPRGVGAGLEMRPPNRRDGSMERASTRSATARRSRRPGGLSAKQNSRRAADARPMSCACEGGVEGRYWSPEGSRAPCPRRGHASGLFFGQVCGPD